MTAIAFLSSHAWAAVAYGLPFLVVLGTVVFVHEFGHFLVGRWCGATVEAFSLGMGPEIAGFTDRKGTRWRLSAVPIGGYVRFAGDRNAASAPDGEALERMTADEKKGSLAGQPLPKRAAIVVAGPIANLVLAFVTFAALAYIMGETIMPPLVDSVVPGSPAEQAGFRHGDVVKSIDGRAIASFPDIINFVSVRAGEAMSVVVERDGRDVALVVAPALSNVASPIGVQHLGQLGLIASNETRNVRFVRPSLAGAAQSALDRCWSTLRMSGEYVWRIAAGRAAPDQLSGPIRIAQLSGVAASFGVVAMINLAAILSLSLGAMNLLPVPLLDGGHLLFYAIEAARGRALTRRAQEFGLRVGLACLMALMVFVTFNDIRQIFLT